MRAFSRLSTALPKGRTLPPAVWRRRHAWMLRLLWAHVIGLFAWGLLAGNRGRFSRRSRAVAVCVGLLTSSAVVVHLMNGAIEGHFHFFVMVTLKIDKSFVDGITDDADDAAIVEGVVRLAHSLGLQAVAEGVETAEQVAMLRAWSCQTGQGYHFARPAEPAEIARMLAASPVVRWAA